MTVVEPVIYNSYINYRKEVEREWVTILVLRILIEI